MDGIQRILRVASTIFLLAFEGFTTTKEAFGVIRDGKTSSGIGVKSQEHYRMFNRLNRDLLWLARSYEYALDNGVKYFCDLCGREMSRADLGDGPWQLHRGCLLSLLEFMEKEKISDRS